MAFAPDHGGGSGLSWISSTSAPTWNHWVAGSDRFIAVEIHTFNGSGAIGATSVTCDGVAMTLAGGISANLEGSHQRGEIWWMDNPGTGTTVPIVVTLSGTTDFFVGFSSSYTGKTSTGIAGFAATQNLSASTSSPTNNVTVPFSDCWLIGGAYSRAGSAPSAGTGTVMRSYADVGQIFGDSDGYVGTGSQTLAFTAASSTWPAVLTIAVSEANTGGGGGITGTVARTQEPNTSAASGTVGTGGITGTVARTQAANTSAASGSVSWAEFVTEVLVNNTETAARASEAVQYNWLPNWRIGDALPATNYRGTGTTEADGTFVVPNIPAGAGCAWVTVRGATAADDATFMQFGTASV